MITRAAVRRPTPTDHPTKITLPLRSGTRPAGSCCTVMTIGDLAPTGASPLKNAPWFPNKFGALRDVVRRPESMSAT